ncbi:kinase-like domain-containing protein [Gilbertella persicaria]|uniref:kinase-like domain-containing protein n=1 Tax=Gilbertella persicaria TaxID=101096 RepID=UPI002220B3CD|nr:kinase-like domain-containing protein [Gilbertella persicaria]KAI8078045.1 kinase-like domain-containing protein [Gilbertella persicaria]
MDTEIQVLKKFKHINVLSMITTHLHPYDNRITCSFFPLYAGGTLNDRIERKGSLEESEAAFIFYQILSGLQYIHKMGIIHCDIKVENIFLSSQSSKTRAVIADFGLAIEQSKRQKEWRDDEYGTRHNYAPEMIQRKEFDERIDVWCAGIVLYRMLCGSHPFMKTIETRHSIIDDWKVFSTRVLQMHPNMKRERIKRVSDEGKFFIYSLLEKDFRCRPTSTKALRDPFILWQISLNDGEFFANYDTYVRKDFVQERSRWFDDEKYIKVDKKPDYHPDWNEQDVEDIRYHRASDSPAPIFTSKKPVRFDVGYEEESYNKTMAERFPKRSFLEKKRKIEEGYQQEEEGFSVGS